MDVEKKIDLLVKGIKQAALLIAGVCEDIQGVKPEARKVRVVQTPSFQIDPHAASLNRLRDEAAPP